MIASSEVRNLFGGPKRTQLGFWFDLCDLVVIAFGMAKEGIDCRSSSPAVILSRPADVHQPGTGCVVFIIRTLSAMREVVAAGVAIVRKWSSLSERQSMLLPPLPSLPRSVC